MRQIFGRIPSLETILFLFLLLFKILFLILLTSIFLSKIFYSEETPCFLIIYMLNLSFPRVSHSAIFLLFYRYFLLFLLLNVIWTGYSAISPESFSILSRFSSIDGWTYRFNVIFTLACPESRWGFWCQSQVQYISSRKYGAAHGNLPPRCLISSEPF